MPKWQIHRHKEEKNIAGNKEWPMRQAQVYENWEKALWDRKQRYNAVIFIAQLQLLIHIPVIDAMMV